MRDSTTELDQAVDTTPDANPLAEIQGTGLCDDSGCQTINAGITEYAPRFALYDDGAAKRRWFLLPAGTQIDTSDMDRWVFPVGTKFWKEFSQNGVRVETRFITKVLEDDNAPNAWLYNAYVWNQTQDAATLAPSGAVDANNTTHDVPDRGSCKDCHESFRPSRVLGFQAIQLDDSALPFGLEDLISDDKLTNPPSLGGPGARFVLPGTQTDKNALGYLHANCGHCHNPSAPTHAVVDIELAFEVAHLATVPLTPTFKSVVKQPGDSCGDNLDNDGDGRVDNGCPDQLLIIDTVTYPFLIVPNDPANSGLLQRMKTTDNARMPKISVETPDPVGDATITAWINSL